VESIHEAINFEELAKSQKADEELLEVLQGDGALRLKEVPVPGTEITLYCDEESKFSRPFVTRPFRKKVFQSLFDLSHPGVKATVKLITQRFVWPGIQRNCRKWAQACLQCQKAKITRHNKAPIGHFKVPSGRFEHIHVDIIGPMPISKGCRYCLTIVDRFSRWPEAIPLPDISANTVATVIFTNWMVKVRHTAPHNYRSRPTV